MARGMMTRKYKSRRSIKASACIFIFYFILSSLPLFSENGKWVIAAQKFSLDKGVTADAVNSKTAEMIPIDILEKIGNSVTRNVMPEEQFEITKYKLRTERQSLFLQLSAEYKKRDALVLSNYSDYKLKSAIKESQKKIDEIQKKIDANLESLKKATEENERKVQLVSEQLSNQTGDSSELNRYKNLFSNIFVRDESLIQQETVTFYKDDFTSLYALPEAQKDLSITDPLCEKTIVSAGINTLLTGHFSKYGEYLSISVDLYNFPGAKLIGSVVEVGTVQELELINTSIAMQLIPILSNAFPVELQIEIEPEEAKNKTMVYIDGVLQHLENGKLIVDSGINTMQFVSEGFKTAATTYNFEGNKKYKIKINFEKPKSGFIQVGLKKPLDGSILGNGERALEIEGKKTQIAINGKEILGEFIAENGETAFFYIPQKLTFDGSYVIINPKPRDRMAYIDKRRKIMYGSYSLLVISLMPTFYTYANYQNNANLYKNGQVDYQTVKNWQTATNITRAISIGCALFWGYELVRYLVAANSVLPEKAKAGKLEDFTIVSSDQDSVTPAENEEAINQNTENKNDGDSE